LFLCSTVGDEDQRVDDKSRTALTVLQAFRDHFCGSVICD